MASHPALAVIFSWRGRPRTLKMGRPVALVLAGVLPLLGFWYFGATAYLVFHDQLLASLLTRQADMQYSYEDRIAVLRSQLERETSRQLVDHQTLSTTIRDLVLRGERLEARTTAIDALIRGSSSILAATKSTPLPSGLLGYDMAPSDSPLRLDDGGERDGRGDATHDKRTELSPEQLGNQLAGKLSRIESRQSEALAQLRDPMMRSVERLQASLEQAGIPPSRWMDGARAEGGVGGPFVPLPADARTMTFEQNLTLLQDAIATHKRLAAVVEQVPLRRPLQGRLEVTSPFGARLDPFYGRAAMHTGIDLMGAYGGAVRATAGGIVTVASNDGGYGQMVEIDHGNGLVTRYAHLSSIDVGVGEHVPTGKIVGRIGSSGRATGPHLHYETRINGEPVDPARFLKAGASLPPA